MTMPGPDRVVACPHCAAPARVPSYASINFGHFPQCSDGGPDLVPSLARCVGCLRCYIVDTAPEVARVAFWDDDGARDIAARWERCAYVTPPNEAECHEALARNDVGPSPRAELQLRTQAWWQRNRPARGSTNDRDVHSLSAHARTNMEALLTLWERVEGDSMLIRAELHRELGRFDEAIRMLQTPGTMDSPQAQQLLDLCMGGDSRMVLLREPFAVGDGPIPPSMA